MLQRARIDLLLTNLSVQYRNGLYVAERVLPQVPVDARTDQYPVFGRENFSPIDDQRSPGAEAREASWSWSPDSYICGGHALKDFIPRENQAEQAPAFDLLQDSTLYLTERMLLNQEVNVVARLAASLTGTSLAAQTATHWDNDANDPVAIIRAQMDVITKRSGVRPNKFTASQPVWTAIQNNAKVKAYLNGGTTPENPALVTPAAFAVLVGVDEVIIASAVKNTANPGQAESMDWVWGETAVLHYTTPTPGRRAISLGYTFVWYKAFSIPGPNGQVMGGQYVEQYYWQPNKADVVEVHKYYDQKVISALCGVLFTDCLT